MTIAEFADAVTQYCGMYYASVTSWGRTTTRNKLVGGVQYSAHRFFRGADVVYDDLDILGADPAGRKEDARRLGLLLLPEGDHDHLQPLTWTK